MVFYVGDQIVVDILVSGVETALIDDFAAVARRCGFELEGKMREARFAYGSYRDELLFAKINPGK